MKILENKKNREIMNLGFYSANKEKKRKHK